MHDINQEVHCNGEHDEGVWDVFENDEPEGPDGDGEPVLWVPRLDDDRIAFKNTSSLYNCQCTT